MIWFEIIKNADGHYEVYKIFDKRSERTCELVKTYSSEAGAKEFASKHWTRKAPWKK